MREAPVGLITSAASEELLKDRRAETVSTPWGNAPVLTGTIGGREVVVILRYGEKLTLPSHKINYHANIWALRELGVESIVSQNAIGSVNPAIRPGDIVISDDFLDKTKSRAQSLFDESECWVRVDFTDPFCPRLRTELIAAANKFSNRVIERGTFVCTEGPRFETPAEIRAYQREGGDIVGTPLIPEVIFAREAEMCFASIAPVINFGAGMAPAVVHFGPGSMNEIYYKQGLHDLIEKTLIEAISALSTERSCNCRNALVGGFHGEPPAWMKAKSCMV
ncbi:MTAP family purine nucleoside phosphorylase [Mesorhizobium sp. CGMCC 1.15528]|uniref:Purine nucleoside phosphorylase n=1 Tax=Mesorhizobium zhangyense TaxID=1776730 RepID=A0A7C9VFQ0_9HYPH|nr:MTAP family purine nucleoside phosphorylase [Mesorhizobium zhangyense]NGN45027.1 MTAP family purine nucleoside phosphorylase [Mesorhizobium zhangyense]